eukprot:snap_masked-scaffold_7-processed-gene-18.30-mRNA-1 protein AED:0.29 eAED:0.31 QI:0/-1/0/1/-1/1/1/0/734
MLKPFMFDSARREFHFYSTANETPSTDQSYISKVHEINGYLQKIATSSEIRKILAWYKGGLQEQRKKIFEVIDNSTPEELNHILREVNLPQLFTYGNYYLTNQENKVTDTLKYLLENREHDLTTFARASLIHTLMRLHTISFSMDQMKWAVKSFLGCSGTDLTLLKALLDTSGDYNNLLKLVFVDIKDEDSRRQILSHINKNSREQIRINKLHKKVPIKVLSDVDDTLYSSGGSFPAGADARLPKHVVYPGVLQLFEEIDMFSQFSTKKLSEEETQAIKAEEEGIKFVSERRRGAGDEREVEEKVDLDNFAQDENEVEFMMELNAYLESRENKNATLVRRSTVLSSFDENDLPMDFQREQDATLLRRRHSKLDLNAQIMPEEQVKVTLELPWNHQESVYQFTFNTSGSVDELRDQIEQKYGLPPWKQNFHVEPLRSAVGSEDENLVRNWRHGNIAFLSARPNVYKDISESQSYRIFQKLMANGLLHATPTMLTGSLRSGLTAIFLRIGQKIKNNILDFTDVSVQLLKAITVGTSNEVASRDDDSLDSFGKRKMTNGNWTGVGEVKVDRFKKYSLLYPECKFLFFGDNAQGDLYAAEKINKYFNSLYNKNGKKSLNRRVMKCFLHKVLERDALSAIKKKKQAKFWKENDILFFYTYVGAAIECLKSKLISVKGLLRVTQRAREEMLKIAQEYPKYDLCLIKSQLNQDIKRANKIFKATGFIQQVPELDVKLGDML